MQRSDEELPGGGAILSLSTPKFKMVFVTGFRSESDAKEVLKKRHNFR